MDIGDGVTSKPCIEGTACPITAASMEYLLRSFCASSLLRATIWEGSAAATHDSCELFTLMLSQHRFEYKPNFLRPELGRSHP